MAELHHSDRNAFGLLIRAFVLGMFAALSLSAQDSSDAEWTVRLDPDASHVSFTLDATGHVVRGTFSVLQGEVSIEPSTGTATGTIEIDARTGDTDSARRDRKMHAEVLLSTEHPTFRFVADRVEGGGCLVAPGQLTLIGQLELLGQHHDLSLPIDCTVDGSLITGTTRFEVPFVDWGLKDPSVFVLKVAKVVVVEVRATGTVSYRPQDTAPRSSD